MRLTLGDNKIYRGHVVFSGQDLRDLREKIQVSQSIIADALGITRQTLIAWEKKKKIDRIDILAVKAFLSGLAPSIISGFDIIEWRNKRGKTKQELSMELGVELRTIQLWESGTIKISRRAALAISYLETETLSRGSPIRKGFQLPH
jgi:DNA-binding transcriptional regulator YiaG